MTTHAPGTAGPVVKDKPWTVALGFDTGPIGVSGFASKDYYEREIELIWKRTWVMVGKVHKIPNPGDYFVEEMPWVRTSIIVVRGKDGKVRAFHNVCSHRGNKVCAPGSGNARQFRCAFHAWTYQLDGSLTGVPDEENFFDLDKGCLGLTPVAVDTWEDFIFVNLTPEPAETLAEYLGDFYHGVHGYPFADYTQEYTLKATLNCNWKVANAAFIEQYHIAFVHKRSFGYTIASRENPFAHTIYCGATKYHSQFSFSNNIGYTPTHMEMYAFLMGGAAASLMARSGSANEFPPCVNPTRHPFWGGDVLSVFPGITIDPIGSMYFVFEFRPVDVDHCTLMSQVCMPPPKNATERWAQEISITTFQLGILEDLRTLEYTQDVIASGAKRHMLLQDEEVLVRALHHTVQQMAGPYPDFPVSETSAPPSLLPEGFEDFEPYLDWALPKRSERSAKKATSTFEELQALYDFALANEALPRALGHCDKFPLDDLPEDARRLFLITLSMAEVRPQVELYGQLTDPSTTDPVPQSRLPITPDEEP